MMGKAAGAELGRGIGIAVVGGITKNPIAARWGGVGGSVAGGAFASYWVDQAEAEIFKQMGIE